MPPEGNSSLRAAKPNIVIIGGGFVGLSAAYDLAKAGLNVTVLEKQEQVGGLAASFDVGGARLEKFYHHLFTSDTAILDLVRELGGGDDIIARRTRTAMYCAGRIYSLSTPMDLLRFSPLGLLDRLRLGRMVLAARKVSDWHALENLTAREWLCQLAGRRVFETVWKPLLDGKFGPYADEVSAVWFWNKLKLRGGSRQKGGAESLIYFRGGFDSVLQRLQRAITAAGGRIIRNAEVTGLDVRNGNVRSVTAGGQQYPADVVLATQPLPVVADLLEGALPAPAVAQLRQIQYLGNVCLVLQMDRPLSDIYWLNVADREFPYVGIIEHTNFEPPATYAGRHIVYLSKYLPTTDALFTAGPKEVFELSCRHLRRLFPQFEPSWVKRYDVWKSPFSQQIVSRHYSRLIPPSRLSIGGLYLASMAQIYPEDRGTNYAVRQGRQVAAQILNETVLP